MSGLFVRWEQRPVCLHGHDHIPVAHSCHAFYHCWGARITIKHCGPFLMFNPVTKVCDWPHTVKYIRPMCDPSYVKPPSNELKRVDLIKPTVNELGTYSFFLLRARSRGLTRLFLSLQAQIRCIFLFIGIFTFL